MNNTSSEVTINSSTELFGNIFLFMLLFLVFIIVLAIIVGLLLYIYYWWKNKQSINYLKELQKKMLKDAQHSIIGRKNQFGYVRQVGDSNFQADRNILGKITGFVELEKTILSSEYGIKLNKSISKKDEKKEEKIYLISYMPEYSSSFFKIIFNMFKKEYLLLIPESRLIKPFIKDLHIRANSLITVFGRIRTINDQNFYNYIEQEIAKSSFNKELLQGVMVELGTFVDKRNDLSTGYTQMRDMEAGKVPSGRQGVYDDKK